MQNEAMWRSGAISTDPEQIRAQIDAVLAQLPDPADAENMPAEADLEEMARRLSEAHDMLVQALESAEKG
jgi:hypothetical protein